MYKFTQRILLALVMINLPFAAHADDIDIINAEIPIDSNVLFIMDLSGSMGEKLPLPGDPTRLDELKGAFQDIVKDPDFEDINMGLSVFSGKAQNFKGASRAHGITFPIAPVIGTPAQKTLDENGLFTHKGISYMPEAGANNTHEYMSLLSTALSTDPSDPAGTEIWAPGGDTPIVDALYEASLYFKGEEAYWGRRTADDVRSAHPSSYKGKLEYTTTPIACTTATRVSCKKGSCGGTEACDTKYVKEVRADMTGGINCGTVDTNRTTCAEGVTKCGLKRNCKFKTLSPKTKICDAMFTNITDCMTANPTWESCKKEMVKDNNNCTPSLEGPPICAEKPVIVCKEPRKRWVCDAPNTYACEFPKEFCTMCPPPKTEITGSAKYVTPIKQKCPANGIILLTDGAPTINMRSDLVAAKIGSKYAKGCAAGSSDERCGRELAKYLAFEDQSDTFTDKQVVNTFTVGLGLMPNTTTTTFLKEVAENGGGSFVNAKDRGELAVAFKRAILAIGKRARSFSAPTYTINPATQLSHGDFVYVPVFDREAAVAWPGNLKKYKLKDGMLFGLDATSNEVKATDKSGKLLAGVQDLWSNAIGVNVIKTGGAANLLEPTSRNVFTDNGASLVGMNTVPFAKYGAADVTERNKLIKFIKGEKLDGTPRHHMGDIVHSKPIQLAYSKTESLILVGTNEGFLHAIKSTKDITDTTDGKEMFAFMPQELLKNIKPQFEDSLLPYHVYGVDGPMKLHLDDKNKNGIKDAGEDAYLYFGLRRGGGSYYALKLGDNITDTPKLAWTVNSKSAGFKNLGFTWSEPMLTKIKHTKLGGLEPVLIFGGGYIDDHNGELVKNKKASDVYVVNAKTGKLLWKTKESDIEFAVPAKIRTVDADRNGSIDRLYFGDTGGNIWRVDLGGRTERYNLSKSTLTHIANLGDGKKVSGADSRKFFTEPDVAFLKYNGRYGVSISIGSGSRPDPLSEVVDNHFFVVLDENVFNYPKATPAYATITMSDLLDAPLSKADSSSLLVNLKKLGSKKGWKMNLNPAVSLTGLKGEKILSTALTFENKIMFTSFGIREQTHVYKNDVECGLRNVNVGRLYVLDLLSGGAVLDLSDDKEVKDPDDRSVELVGGEILETPQIVYPNGFTAKDGKACTTDDCSRGYEIHAGKGPAVAGTTPNTKTKTNKPVPVSKKLPRVYWLDSDQ